MQHQFEDLIDIKLEKIKKNRNTEWQQRYNHLCDLIYRIPEHDNSKHLNPYYIEGLYELDLLVQYSVYIDTHEVMEVICNGLDSVDDYNGINQYNAAEIWLKRCKQELDRRIDKDELDLYIYNEKGLKYMLDMEQRFDVPAGTLPAKIKLLVQDVLLPKEQNKKQGETTHA